MGVRLVTGFIALLSFAACSEAQSIEHTYSPDQYFKNYALSVCLADAYKSDDEVKDASKSARGYLELGSYPLEAHTEAIELSKEFSKKKYKSITGDEITLMKCIDFYHSKELDKISKKYMKKSKK
jgi:hypothetical protein